MKLKDKRAIRSAEMTSYLKESRGLERDFIHELVVSRRRAWGAAAFAGCVAVLGVVAGIAGLSQDTPDPVVLRVDAATGAVDEVSVMTPVEQTYGEVVDQYWLNLYILNRESYDYNTIQMNYDTTALLSTPTVQTEYLSLYEGSNARNAVLGNKSRVVVSVRSIQPNGKGQATVRFTVQQVNRNGTNEPAENLIGTVGYTYVNAPMASADRRINPLGFQITSYRVDPETLTNGVISQ